MVFAKTWFSDVIKNVSIDLRSKETLINENESDENESTLTKGI